MFSINDTISEDMSKSGVSAVSESNATARSGDTEERKTTGFWGCERCAGIITDFFELCFLSSNNLQKNQSNSLLT